MARYKYRLLLLLPLKSQGANDYGWFSFCYGFVKFRKVEFGVERQLRRATTTMMTDND